MELDVKYSVLNLNDSHVNLLDNHDRADDEHIDRAGYRSLIKKHRKTIVIGILVILVIIAIIGNAVGITVNEENGNTSNNVASHANNASGSNSTSVGETYIFHTTKGKTNTSERETCIYHTPKKFLEELKSLKRDPLEDKCNYNSTHVIDLQHFCAIKGVSRQRCSHRCGANGIYLPDFCFCDQVAQCNNPLYDRNGTIPCENCLEILSKSPYKNRGNCTCSLLFITCLCYEGFANYMCSSIEKTLCESLKKKDE